jgi:hypothetical protein
VSEPFVTVARFTSPLEAQLAVGRLEAEGIQAYLTGDLSASVFSGMGALGGQVHLQVLADDQERAVQVLEECVADTLSGDGKSPIENDTAIWVCPLCGDAVRVILPVCPSCHTLRGATPAVDPAGEGAIQDAPSPASRRRRKPCHQPSPQGVQKLEAVSSQPPPLPAREDGGEIKVPQLAVFYGDERARRALHAALASLVIPILLPFCLPYSVFLVFSLWFHDGELSTKGQKSLYLTLVIHGIFLVILLLLCAGLS